jgi:thiol-disulfide isomerase/thioredoxin
MRCLISGVLALTLISFASSQDKSKDESKKPETGSRAEQFKSIEKESQETANELLKTYRQAKDKDEKAKALKDFQDSRKKFAPRMLELAKAKPEDDVACDAAIWLVRFIRNEGEGKEAIEIIRKHHLTNPKMASAAGSIRFALGDDAAPLLQRIFDLNPDKKAKAFALHALANLATGAAVDYLTSEKEIPIKAELAERLWGQLQREYGDIELGNTSFGEMAKDELYMIKNLFPGCKSPEILGEDTTGKPMKLSDYKGKVVMLDFWGTWCGPCMQMVPHNVEVAKKYADKPFVIVGVNSDTDKVKLAKRIEEEKITYRSFWNGQNGPGGPISKEWKVQAWPTIVLIDQKGVIRRRFLGSPDTEAEWKGLNQALETLIKDAEVK